MDESVKGKKSEATPGQAELMELMQRLREAIEEMRARRVQVIQDLHC
jgi:signal transduction histidine kinase